MEKERYRVGIIGFAHMHVNNVAAYFAENPRIDLCAFSDTLPAEDELKDAQHTRDWNKKFVRDNFGIAREYSNYIDMLDKEDLDLCIVTSENVYHPEITEECAKRGVGVSIEKPMAVNLSDGLKMYRSAKKYNSLLIVNWPITWNPGMHMIKKLIERGEIGDLISIKTHMGHAGPLEYGVKTKISDVYKARTWWHQSEYGGGAMLDYCCYGSMLCYWYAGKTAVAVTGMRINSITTMGNAEDNAAMIVRFESSYAVVEGTWTTVNHGIETPIVYGTQGTIVGNYKTGEVSVYNSEGKVKKIHNEKLPENMANVAASYVSYMDTGEPFHCTQLPEFNLDALAILDAGIRSSNSGHTEIVNNLNWNIG